MVVGDSILKIVQSAQNEVLIAAPFVKLKALERLLSEIPTTVQLVTCVTRWLPEDIACGVCDLEIFDLLQSRQNSRLFVHPYLHAKFFRADSVCVVGSANVTHRALGWITPPNLELTVELPADFDGLHEWEQRLMAAAIPATIELRDQIAAAASKLKDTIPAGFRPPEAVAASSSSSPPGLWLPSCPVPDRLWGVYQGQGPETMVTSAWEAARADLLALLLPGGLSKPLFLAFMAGILRQMPLVQELDNLAANGLTDVQAHTFLTERLDIGDPHQVEQAWQVMKAWLTYFFPESYRVEVRQEVLVKGRQLPDVR